MKTMQNTMGWLVEAAARTKAIATVMAVVAVVAMGTAACSSDDNIAETPQIEEAPQAQQRVHITVGAGVGSDEQTRSLVDYNTSTKQRTLKFTAGDRLYVRAGIEQEYDSRNDGEDPENKHDSKIMAGFLDIDASSISADGKSAQFSGDLDIYVGTVNGYKWDDDLGNYVKTNDGAEYYVLEFSSGTHTFATSNPIAECIYSNVWLVHAGSDTKYTIDDNSKDFDYGNYLVANSNDLMSSTFLVMGGYDTNTNTFILASFCGYAILNGSISGLTAGTQYRVKLNNGATTDYDEFTNYEGSVTADGTGNATFAVRVPCRTDNYFQLVLVSKTERKVVNLGQKTIEEKVYNVTATATDYVFPAGQPVVYGTLAELNSGSYQIEEDPADVTISGTFMNYDFSFYNSGTVRLNNVTAIYDSYNIIYGFSSVRDLTVVLTGDNKLTCLNSDFAIGSNSNLKLQCTGSSATLTVTTSGLDALGFSCNNYDIHKSETSNLAATGYSVTLTSEINGPDNDSDGNPDYCTWTYKVTKN